MLQQTFKNFIVRPAAVLTNSYVAGNIIGNSTDFPEEGGGVRLTNQLSLYIFFTLGSLSSMNLKIEFSNDPLFGTGNVVQETNSVISGATSTDTPIVHSYTATTAVRYLIPIKDQYIRVSVQGVGTVASSSCNIIANIGIA